MDSGLIDDQLRLITEELAKHQKHIVEHDTEDRVRSATFLPTQRSYLEAVNNPDQYAVLMYGPNGCGKSHLTGYDLYAECMGFEPWSGRERPTVSDTPYPVALLLPDFESHARKFLEQNVYQIVPRRKVKIERTHDGAPRVIWFENAIRPINIYTSKQDVETLEASNFQRVHVDEPCSRTHLTALRRGLRQTNGKVTMTMTNLSQWWITDEFFDRAANQGGDRVHYCAFIAEWWENIKEYGGHIPLKEMERFWETLDEDELEARKFGKPKHLSGVIYPNFDVKVHVIDREMTENPELTCPWGLVVDPHDRRPFAMVWFYVDPSGTIVVRHEFPYNDFYAMKSSPYVYDDYPQLINQGPALSWAIIDPRKGRCRDTETGLILADRLGQDTNLTFIDDVSNRLVDGHQAVKERLRYDRNQPVSWTNKPKLFIHESCKNTIRGMRNYTWQEWSGKAQQGRGPKDAPREDFKDFPDLLRYLCMCEDVRYFDPQAQFRLQRLPRRRPKKLRPTLTRIPRGRYAQAK